MRAHRTPEAGGRGNSNDPVWQEFMLHLLSFLVSVTSFHTQQTLKHVQEVINVHAKWTLIQSLNAVSSSSLLKSVVRNAGPFVALRGFFQRLEIWHSLCKNNDFLAFLCCWNWKISCCCNSISGWKILCFSIYSALVFANICVSCTSWKIYALHSLAINFTLYIQGCRLQINCKDSFELISFVWLVLMRVWGRFRKLLCCKFHKNG